MAVVLPTQSPEVVVQANTLLTEADEQGQIVFRTAFKNKEVANRLESVISSFSITKIIQDESSTTEILNRAESNFDEIQECLALIFHKENDLNSLIQKMFERQRQGSEESMSIQAKIAEIEANLSSTETQISETQENVTRLESEVQELEANLQNAQRQLNRTRKRRRRWIIATVLTAGIASPGLIANEQAVGKCRSVRSDRQEMLNSARSNLNSLQDSKITSETEKERLVNENIQLQCELTEVANILSKLKSALNDTVSYRMFLLHLSDSLKDVRVHIQHFLRNIAQISAIQAQGIAIDRAVESNMKESHRGLAESWRFAREKTPVQIILFLTDAAYVEATLNFIKAIEWS